MTSRLRSIGIAELGKKGLSLIFLVPLALFLSTAVTGASNYQFLIATAGIIFFTILTSFNLALLLIGLFSYFFPYAIWYFLLPGPLVNLGYALIIMMLLRELFFTAGFLPIRTPINYILASIVALAFLSIAAGDSGVYASFKGLLRHIGFPLLFILILGARPDEKLMRKLVAGVIAVAFLQVLASTWQFVWYSTINVKNPGMRADLCGGLLGHSCGDITAVLMAMTFCLVLGFIIVHGFRLYWGLGAVLLLVPIYLASARAGVIFFALGAFFMLLIAPLPRHGSFFKRLIVAAGIIGLILAVALTGLGGESFSMILKPNYAYDYSIKQADSGMGRLQSFDIVGTELRTPAEKLIGRGPGMLTPTSIVDNPNSLIAKNPLLFRHVNGYAYTALELGYLGVALFLLLFVQVYRFNRRFLKRIDDPFWESISLGFCGVTFIYIVSTIYTSSLVVYPLSFTYWALAAAIYRAGVIRGILTV